MAAYSKAVAIDPSYVDAQFALGVIHAKRGEPALAIDRFRRALQVRPDWVPAQTQLAWLLATTSNASSSDRRAALTLAEQAVARTSDPDAGALDALAAALAANGQFERAVETAERMLVVLGSDADQPTIAAARDRLALLPCQEGLCGRDRIARIRVSESKNPNSIPRISQKALHVEAAAGSVFCFLAL